MPRTKSLHPGEHTGVQRKVRSGQGLKAVESQEQKGIQEWPKGVQEWPTSAGNMEVLWGEERAAKEGSECLWDVFIYRLFVFVFFYLRE